ncbi:hypothetical protein MAR_003369 [Mya arenaria]|uniref:Uncharacterized protein n=1 Tax=Mya arenaria TaxID=6604 RepID=A0ABY7GF33_MYAAR|nr:hypothetical protein MAR_003369 [Mya arenaria]
MAGGKIDVFNITSMLSLVERSFKDEDICIKIAFTLFLGGNDFMPKYYAISHDSVLKNVIQNAHFKHSLYTVVDGRLIKYLITP